jgi:hypothetical protein
MHVSREKLDECCGRTLRPDALRACTPKLASSRLEAPTNAAFALVGMVTRPKRGCSVAGKQTTCGCHVSE